MKVSLDRDRCEGYGFCVDAAPEIFSFDHEDELVVHHPEVPDEPAARAAAAVRTCPVAALTTEP
jgi:ferredoxin